PNGMPRRPRPNGEAPNGMPNQMPNGMPRRPRPNGEAPNGMANGTQRYKSMDEALNLIRDSVSDEREEELFYDYLISEAPTDEERDIIEQIRDDKIKHNNLFRRIYEDMTGDTIDVSEQQFQRPDSYIEGIKSALKGELDSVEKYRDIRAGLNNQLYRDMVFEIITDELEHADKFNYILYLNR
ncbi:MAG: ferritin family protein, partial [Eubacteriales bacterium]